MDSLHHPHHPHTERCKRHELFSRSSSRVIVDLTTTRGRNIGEGEGGKGSDGCVREMGGLGSQEEATFLLTTSGKVLQFDSWPKRSSKEKGRKGRTKDLATGSMDWSVL